MRSYIFIALAALFALACAVPITPSAPRLQKRAEQYRLQGLAEFQIAERLSSSASSFGVDPWRARLNKKLHALLDAPPTDEEGKITFEEEAEDFSGDIAPGTLEAPSALPKALKEASMYDRLCAMFHRAESSFGYEGKELELRRPEGVQNWKQSFGSFRRHH
ncbi:hypothetical protein COCC4DRAFT_50883 [Bipolaris maydis ATCC 48331]|uniref:Uncharacterized protein n=2 Tax=Cochliobolus heterostrophus TaxID=5016 RepID=M2U2R5_COCH5|nr:uncharacterized protein COCC4DRAFT_50883 [Bipolaris maydis ATCC 48331]EMD92804.1 hypothetical protein COCHEDRAFT_1193187 [Bipolaris maydis C5]KAJ5026108.1 hypothetical protein J3E73DRAFT_313290 [Bipolaris maydis]ENI04807.1 hypothetical protein COCC4DRAFT_50883 [Bipolaris maydis ATCC 48331]KAJ5056646.1 hypothetical protein J3E74DRAFT_374230 [Bipolaris maydis]KAJ6196235.1 hypothetical protein J3E72DRAFT_333701 [Bipolaris maydis]